MKRFDASVGSSLLTLAVIVGVGLLLSLVTVVPNGSGAGVVSAGDASGAGGSGGGSDGSIGDGDGGLAGIAGATDGEGGGDSGAGGDRGRDRTGPGDGGSNEASAAQCAAGKNGGSTDVGVTGSSIKLASTIVADGPGSSFLGPVRVAMSAVVNEVNTKKNGVCGRRLQLSLRNDSWDATRGKTYLQNFVESDKVFALAVVPSSEGLKAADAYIRDRGVPVVGTDGMLKNQYRNPWIWPVATSTVSTMHIMAKEAHDRGARTFGIVFDAKYHFGVEGAFAFNQAVKRLTNKDIPGFDPSLKSCVERFCGIQPGQPAYTNEAHKFNEACFGTAAGADTCDFAAYLLEPDTAVSFLREPRASRPRVGLGGAQPLFNRSFAENCKTNCSGMWVWTGYNPPIEALAALPGVAKYAADVKQESASVDPANQFVEGGYLGMSLMVAALEKTGPNLTRQALRATLDSMTFDIGLSKPLSWKKGDHIANRSAQAFEINYTQAFNGWRQKTGFIDDPWVGQDL